jgi:hypothetical protein
MLVMFWNIKWLHVYLSFNKHFQSLYLSWNLEQCNTNLEQTGFKKVTCNQLTKVDTELILDFRCKHKHYVAKGSLTCPISSKCMCHIYIIILK